MNRGIEPCLVLHPQKVWDHMIEKIFSRNQFIEKNRRFARRFTNGSTEIVLDGNARILIPKRLMEYAGLKKDLILVAQYDKVEIWDLERYEQWLDFDDDDFGLLAEEVMGEGSALASPVAAPASPAPATPRPAPPKEEEKPKAKPQSPEEETADDD
jgi:MraZ protein